MSGCCLTVAHDPRPSPGCICFDVVPQTLALTTLGELREGSRVNLEHAATPTTLLGGHVVQGHVDDVGTVRAVARGAEHRLRVGVRSELLELIAPRGSICVDGVSLTVADTRADWFEVVLIPTTLERTTLSSLVEGSRVNVECDALARHVVHYLRQRGLGA